MYFRHAYPHLFCHFCGQHYSSEALKLWPWKCATCECSTYRNPAPVVVAIVPVSKHKTLMGALVIRRNIEPAKGTLALPGGYVDFGESFEQAAAREIEEEVGIVTPASEYRLLEVKTTPSGSSLIIFCGGPIVLWEDVQKAFKPNREVSEVAIALWDAELGFPLHTDALRRYAHDPR